MNAAIGHRLETMTVFLSASVPTRDFVRTDLYTGELPRFDDQDLRIEAAVTAVARAVFRERGQLVFGGHPAISPLVAMVADEYFPASTGESRDAEQAAAEPRVRRPIIVFQSKCFERVIVDDVRDMERLGQASVVWTNPVEGEVFNEARAGDKQCDKSLALMRDQMLHAEPLAAMICIGGMDGIFEEFQAYVASGNAKRIFVFSTTGGASCQLATMTSESTTIEIVDERFSDLPFGQAHAEHVPPYDNIAQMIVEKLAGPDDGDSPLPSAIDSIARNRDTDA
jgi:hypothetical protein